MSESYESGKIWRQSLTFSCCVVDLSEKGYDIEGCGQVSMATECWQGWWHVYAPVPKYKSHYPLPLSISLMCAHPRAQHTLSSSVIDFPLGPVATVTRELPEICRKKKHNGEIPELQREGTRTHTPIHNSKIHQHSKNTCPPSSSAVVKWFAVVTEGEHTWTKSGD